MPFRMKISFSNSCLSPNIFFKCSSYLKDKSGCFVSQQVGSISSSELEIASLRLVNLILILQKKNRSMASK